jgi:hypothetical protein
VSKYVQLNGEIGGVYAQLCIGSSRAREQPSAQLVIVGWLLCTCATTSIASNHPLSWLFIHDELFTGIEQVQRLLPKITCLYLLSHEASAS